MRMRVFLVVVALFTGGPSDGSATGPQERTARPAGTTGTAADADGALAEFEARVDDYVALRKQAAQGAPKLKPSEDPAAIVQAQDALAARIRALRADAKHGDIFTIEARNRFRRLLKPELKGEDGRDARAILKDDAPAPGAVPLKVNAKYPAGSPLPTVPATLLLSLPTLPEGLEYRIIGKDLVLLDTHANIIVDYIRNAIP